jgi:hypothetical protein
MIGMSEDPTHPQGFSQFTEGQEGEHLGKPIAFETLPENIQKHIEERVVKQVEGSVKISDQKTKGRGTGGYSRGEKIKSAQEVNVGDLLIYDNEQFDATNLIEVTRKDDTGLNRDIFYAEHIDPSTNTKAGEEFAVWDFDLESNNIYKAVKGTGDVNPELGATGVEGSTKVAKSPPGWSKTVEKMKEHPEIDNPFALAWSEYNKGYKSHKGSKKTATGEPDQDYDHEFFDAIVSQLEAAGISGASHRQFDLYQGVYLSVPGVGKFWISDSFSTGQETSDTKDRPYSGAYLVDENGEQSSANADDYFMQPDGFVFEGHTLVITDRQGKQKKIENPKKSDLPKGESIRTTFQYEKGSEAEHVIFSPESDPDTGLEVTKTGDQVDASQLVEYAKSKKPTPKGKAKKSDLDKVAGTELWQTPEGKYWLLGTVMMEPVSPVFDTKEEAVDFAIKEKRWDPSIRERVLSEDVDGTGNPNDLSSSPDVQTFSMDEIQRASEKDAARKEKPEPHQVAGTNLWVTGFGRDVNGNSVVYVDTPNQRARAIQTNGVLPATYSAGRDGMEFFVSSTPEKISEVDKEIKEYVEKYETGKLKEHYQKYDKAIEGTRKTAEVAEIDISTFKENPDDFGVPAEIAQGWNDDEIKVYLEEKMFANEHYPALATKTAGGGAGIRFENFEFSGSATLDGKGKIIQSDLAVMKFDAHGYMDGMSDVSGRLLKVTDITLSDIGEYSKDPNATFEITIPQKNDADGMLFGGYQRPGGIAEGTTLELKNVSATAAIYLNDEQQETVDAGVSIGLAFVGEDAKYWYEDVFGLNYPDDADVIEWIKDVRESNENPNLFTKNGEDNLDEARVEMQEQSQQDAQANWGVSASKTAGGGAGIRFENFEFSGSATLDGKGKIIQSDLAVMKFDAHGYMDGMSDVSGRLLKVTDITLSDIGEYSKDPNATFEITIPQKNDADGMLFGGYQRPGGIAEGTTLELKNVSATAAIYLNDEQQETVDAGVSIGLAFVGEDAKYWYEDVFGLNYPDDADVIEWIKDVRESNENPNLFTKNGEDNLDEARVEMQEQSQQDAQANWGVSASKTASISPQAKYSVMSTFNGTMDEMMGTFPDVNFDTEEFNIDAVENTVQVERLVDGSGLAEYLNKLKAHADKITHILVFDLSEPSGPPMSPEAKQMEFNGWADIDKNLLS